MTGSLTHVGGDRWKVRIYAGLDAHGHQRLRSKTFTARNEREAKREVHRHVAALQSEVDAVRAEKGTVAEAVKAWRDMKATTMASSTRARTDQITDRIIADLGPIPLSKLTARHVDEWYGTLRDGSRSEATVHHYHRILHGVLRQAERWELVDRIATARATPPKRPRPQFTIPDSRTLLAVVADASPDLRFATGLAISTGLRRGELVGLRWGDVDGDVLRVRRSIVELPGRPLEVKLPKSGRGRDIAVGPEVRHAFVGQRARGEIAAEQLGAVLDPDAYVLPRLAIDPRGLTPRRPAWLSQAWKRLCAKHGVRIRLHDLRHFNATALLDAGIPATTVASRLGHAQTSTTVNIYGHATRQAGELAALQSDRLLSSAP